MAKVSHCPRCGAGLVPGLSHCRLCAQPLDVPSAAAPEAVSEPPESTKTAGPEEGGRAAHPLLTVWFHPRGTIRRIVRQDASRDVLPIVMAGGLFQTLGELASRGAGDVLSLRMILILALTLGPVVGVVGLYLSGALIRWTGQPFGGEGRAETIRAAIAWGGVPLLAGNLLWLPAIALAGRGAFTSEMPALSGMAALLPGVWPVQAAAALWSLVTFLQCVGEVQGFSAWRALGNVALACLVVAGSAALLVAALLALTSSF